MSFYVKQGVVQLPKKPGQLKPEQIIKGEIVPKGALSEEECQRLVKAGILVERSPESFAEMRSGLPPTKGKWNHDPASLADKSIEQLRILVQETDPVDFSALNSAINDMSETEQCGWLVQQLTADFEPVFQKTPDTSDDRTRQDPKSPALRRAKEAAGSE